MTARADGTFSGIKAERAIIDIGSNTVRIVVYGGARRAPSVLFNEKVTARLGRDIAETGMLAPEAIELALRGLRRYAMVLDDLSVTDIETVATAATRDAANGPEFLGRVRQAGLAPRLISGEEEARLSAMGVLGAFPGGQGVVADLGGGSLELTPMGGGLPATGVSLPLGTLRLPELRGKDEGDMAKAIVRQLKRAGWAEPVGETLYLVGGTWRALAVYVMQQQGHPLSDPHGFEMAPDEAKAFARKLVSMSPDKLRETPRISTMRANGLPDAAVLLGVLLDRLQPARIVVSAWGLREGLLFDRLEPVARAQDPLLAGVAVFAAQRGASATLATRVAGWTVGAIPPARLGNERLRLAATMMALASMQTEPNLRITQAVDWALYKRWIGIDGVGRAMLAATSCANGNRLDLPREVRELASEQCLEEAICWGLAIRLCRRLGACSRRSLQMSELGIEDGKLVLRVAESYAPLYGIPNEKDLRLLAGRLGLEPEMRVVDEAVLGNSADQPLEMTPAAI